jgi:drug/metabolite transporter (DMT)-like permease
MSQKPPFSPYLALALALVAVSTAAVMIRIAQGEAPSLVIAASRLVIATVVLAPFALSRYRDELAQLPHRQWVWAGLAGLFLAAHFATWITSLEYTSVASSVVLVATVPLWVALASPALLKEKLPLIALIGLVVALAGSTIVGLSEGCQLESGRLLCSAMGNVFQGRAMVGNLLALAGAVCDAAYIMIGRKARGTLSTVPYIFIVYGVAAVVLMIVSLSLGYAFTGYSVPVYACLLLLGLVPQLIGHSTVNWALKYLSASFVSVALLGEPISATVLALIFLGEAPSVLEIGGGVLILVGIYLATRSEK